MIMRKALICLGLIATCVATSRVQADFLVEYTGGHADMGLAIEADGSLFLHYHFGKGSAVLNGAVVGPLDEDEFAPGDAFVRVPDAAKFFPGIAVPFLGTGVSDPIWVLPQASTAGIPFFGNAAEEVPSGPGGFSSAGFRLTGFSGPAGGNFALWQSPAVGPANVLFQTIDGLPPAPNVFNVGIGLHDHANWGFSKEGVYNLTIEGFANPFGGGTQLTDTGVFTFAVGNATAVPEPSSIALIAFCGVGLISIHRRLRKTNGNIATS